MSSRIDALVARAQSSYRQLSVAANDLNKVSDEFGETIAELDAALKKLNIGISTWVEVASWTHEQNPYHYGREEIGYAKISGKWGIGLRTISGDEGLPDGEEHVDDQWHFNDAPRDLRLSAIEKIPDLFDRLTQDALASTERIQEKLAEAKRLTAAINLQGRTPAIAMSNAAKNDNKK